MTSIDIERAKALAVTLHGLYPGLDVYVRVRTLADQDALVAAGVRHAGTGYIESTMVRCSSLLTALGVPKDDVVTLVESLQADDYAAVRAAYVDVAATREQ